MTMLHQEIRCEKVVPVDHENRARFKNVMPAQYRCRGTRRPLWPAARSKHRSPSLTNSCAHLPAAKQSSDSTTLRIRS